MKKEISLGLLVLSFLLIFISPEAQEKREAGKVGQKKGTTGFGFIASRSPIDITSDTVEGDQKQNVVTFKGNVIAKQGDSTLFANQLTLYYDPESKKLIEIVATGNVKVTQGDRRASGQRAIFYQNENKIVLEGEVVIREGDNVIRGEKVVYLIEEEKSYFEGGKGGRVTTTIVPLPREEKKK